MRNARLTLGTGVYTIPQASRLTGVPVATIRRWVYGYRYPVRTGIAKGRYVVAADIPKRPGTTALSFNDLIELRFVEAFRKAGLSWAKLRPAAVRAAEITGNDHPFSTNRFRTDGQALFMDEVETLDRAFLDILTDQRAFRQVIAPGLKNVEFDPSEHNAVRWWPNGRSSAVVLDPKRAFGQPIVADEGVRTLNLAMAYSANRSYQKVARWYEVSVASVKDAVRFERRLAA